MSKEQLTAVFSCVFLVSVFISSVSQILLKKSADKTYDSKLKEYLNPLVIVAYGMFFCSMLITMYCYRFVDVSAGPILESAGYVFVAVLGYIFLKEKFTKKKIIGMVVLLCGIALFALGGYLPFFNA
ncbi:MAG: EamA family transporter [Ruminococcus sp.]|nr:EamA family transporter [Ruminococcus sp.]MBQ3952759.1 EamA family transporter [Ruminococcus sp.]